MVLTLPGVPQTLFKHSADFGQGFEKRNVRSATVVVASDGTGDFEDIQEGINELGTDGGIVIIKKGTYNIDTIIEITTDSVTLQGVGHSTEIKNSVALDRLVRVATNVDYCVIENVHFNGAGGLGNGAAVSFEGATSRSRISGCWFSNWEPRAIVFLSAGVDISIENCAFNSVSGAGPNYAILINASSNLFIKGNYSAGGTNVYGIQVYTGTSRWISILDNQMKDCVTGISILGTSGTVQQSLISNNIIINSSSDGIWIDTSSANLIIGNNINTAAYGISIENNSDGNSMSNNLITNCTLGIDISSATADKNLIIGNNFDGNTTNYNDGGTLTEIGHNLE